MITEKNLYYHVFNRGCNKGKIFIDSYDYNKLLSVIRESKYPDYVNIIAFALMPNHYHFLVQQNSDKLIFKWFRYIFNTYSQYYNARHKRIGTLFESAMKLKEIKGNTYLDTVINYIHSNPKSLYLKQFSSLALTNNSFVFNKYYVDYYGSFDAYLESFRFYKSGKESEGLEY